MNAETRRASRTSGQESPEELEREVDQARANLGETVEALSQRLSPGQLLDQALGLVREHGGEFGRNLGAEVKQNPLPLLLTSVGITWMMVSRGSPGAANLYASADGPYASADGQTRGSGKGAIGKAADKTRQFSSEAGETIRHAGESIRDTSTSIRDSAHSVQNSFQNLLHEQPLLAGSLGVALGAALGAIVPPTQTEDKLMGRTSDHALDDAKTAAQEKYRDVRQAAKETREKQSTNSGTSATPGDPARREGPSTYGTPGS